MGRTNGFTLIELMIVIAIMAIIAAIALPNLLSGQRAANERSVSSCLRTICTVEYDFRSNDRDANAYGDFWTGDLSGLYRLEDAQGNPIRLVELPVAQQDGNPLAAGAANGRMGPALQPLGTKAGYWIRALEADLDVEPDDVLKADTDPLMGPVHHAARFGFIAYPDSYGISGNNLFIVNASSVVLRLDPGTEAVAGGAPPQDILPAWVNYPDKPLVNGWSKLD